MSKINVGLVGTGFMGKAHVFGFATAQRVFDLPIDFYMEMVADANEKLASAAGKALGFSGIQQSGAILSPTPISASST